MMKEMSSNRTHQGNGATTNNRAVVLVVGDFAQAIRDSDRLSELGFRKCKGIPEAIAASERNRIGRIFVVMSSFSGRLESALQSLRRASHDSPIILLAQMYEEPMARRLLRSPRNPTMPADDYHICPVDTALLGDAAKPAGQAAPLGLLQAGNKDARIRELERLATEDDLTGLKNRRYVREFMRQIIERAKKQELRVTLLIFDIDNFKHYNDTYGHAVGDMVLTQAALMMRRCCRAHDVVGRIGGDEFAVVFWDCPARQGASIVGGKGGTERRGARIAHPQEALFIAERFREEISSAEFSFLGHEGKGVLTISGGLAAFSSDGMTMEQLFEQSDKAMLEAKRSGKNRIYLVGKPK